MVQEKIFVFLQIMWHCGEDAHLHLDPSHWNEILWERTVTPLTYSAFPSCHPAGERVKGNEVRSAAPEHSDLVQTSATHKPCHPEKFFPSPEPAQREPQQEPQAAHCQHQHKPWRTHIRQCNGGCLKDVIFPCTKQVISKCKLNKLILTSYWFLIALK